MKKAFKRNLIEIGVSFSICVFLAYVSAKSQVALESQDIMDYRKKASIFAEMTTQRQREIFDFTFYLMVAQSAFFLLLDFGGWIRYILPVIFIFLTGLAMGNDSVQDMSGCDSCETFFVVDYYLLPVIWFIIFIINLIYLGTRKEPTES